MTTSPTTARALVVYESMFGNTRAVAEAVAEVLAGSYEVRVLDVAAAPTTIDDVDLLVVGAPTHAFGMSRAGTRKGARDKGATGGLERGVREWLAGLTIAAVPGLAAVFDTKIRGPYPGSARRPIARRLRRLGLRVATPASFVVTGTAGPLADGQLDAAQRWASTLIAATSMAAAPR
jgi:hypothetical protein